MAIMTMRIRPDRPKDTAIQICLSLAFEYPPVASGLEVSVCSFVEICVKKKCVIQENIPIYP